MNHRSFLFPSILLTTLAAVACGPGFKLNTNINQTNEEAKLSLQAKNRRTNEIKGAAAVLREALWPIERILKEIDELADIRVGKEKASQRAKRELRKFISQLRDGLHRMADEAIEFRNDGTWHAELNLQIEVLKDGEYCDKVSLLIDGERKLDYEQAVFRLQDCFAAEPREIARLKIKADGSIDVSILQDGLNGLKPEQEIAVAKDACVIEHVKGGRTHLYCDPLLIQNDGYLGVIKTLELSNERNQVTGNVVINIYSGDKVHEIEWNSQLRPMIRVSSKAVTL